MKIPGRTAPRAAVVMILAVLVSMFAGSAMSAPNWQGSQPTDQVDVRVNQTTTFDQQEPSISVNPLNPNDVLAAAKDWRTGPKQVWDYRSTDGGRTWTDGYPNLLPSELPDQSDPVVEYDATGTAYMSVLGYNQSDFSVGGVFVSRSSDLGATWQPAVLLSANSEQYFNDKEWLTIDRSNNPATRGYIYVTWTLFTTISPTRETSQIVISRSTDGGETFSGRQPVSPTAQDSVQGSFPVVGPNGNVYVLYYSGTGAAAENEKEEGGEDSGSRAREVQALQTGSGADALYIVKSTDGGASFGQPAEVAPVNRPPSTLATSDFRVFVLPELAADPNNGALYVTWNDYSTGRSDVMLVASKDDGKTWSAPVKVNDDKASDRADHFFPSVVVGKDSTVHLIWLDRRDDPSNHLYRPYYAKSTDGGKTFTPNMALSGSESDPDIGFEGTLIGDYISIDVSGDGSRFYATWVDTRGGDQDIYFTTMSTTSPALQEPVTLPAPRATPVAVPSPQPLTGFSDRAFLAAWEKPDRAVLTGQAQRPWVWGPVSFAAATEPYKQGINGERQVLYFDKARMEINNPDLSSSSPNFVTNGLLVVELISGRIQIGNNEFAPQRPPANVPVAGDENSPNALTYASLAPVASLNNDNRAADRTGEAVTARLNLAGQVSDDPGKANLVKIARYEPTLGHNIPDVFWSFMNATGPIYNARFGTYPDGPILDWVSDVGYPITEPYWTNVQIGGIAKDVLVQAFQRRVLTYVADNPPGWQVEMGNVGRQYFDWRYGSRP